METATTVGEFGVGASVEGDREGWLLFLFCFCFSKGLKQQQVLKFSSY